ncbi:four helix bundle protein [Phocaeicola dorei]|uniref:hypothetical protein n=1 Tax=Phocaeicola dorei TaxID=357276 RepID=UPI001F452715|nr:hypothetical protein [Phocaeicola dorei]MCE8761401.1 hypothetical protein [Phocaeicola dorei]
MKYWLRVLGSLKNNPREADRRYFFYDSNRRITNLLCRVSAVEYAVPCHAGFSRFYKYSLGIRMVDICLDMSMLLYERLEKFLRETYRENNQLMLLYLLHETIFNRPEKN